MVHLVKRPLIDRFCEKFDILENECWEWTASRNIHGYGQIAIARGKPRGAHRVAYELTVGPIPEGLQIDHLCHNRGCVNPDHLEAVTPWVNYNRSTANHRKSEIARERTHCRKAGHSLEGNTYSPPGTTYRCCSECRRISRRRWMRENGGRG